MAAMPQGGRKKGGAKGESYKLYIFKVLACDSTAASNPALYGLAL